MLLLHVIRERYRMDPKPAIKENGQITVKNVASPYVNCIYVFIQITRFLMRNYYLLVCVCRVSGLNLRFKNVFFVYKLAMKEHK